MEAECKKLLDNYYSFIENPDKEIIQKPGEFIHFVEHYLKQKQELNDIPEWITLLTKALKPSQISIQTRDKLLAILGKICLYYFHKQGHSTSYLETAYSAFLNISRETYLNAEDNLSVGEALVSVANDSHYYLYSDLANKTQSTLTNEIALSLWEAKDCHVALMNGIVHLYTGIKQLNFQVDDNTISLLSNIVLPDNKKNVKIDSNEEKMKTPIANKITCLKKRSRLLEELGWHDFTRELKKGKSYKRNEPFAAQLYCLKFHFETAKPYSYEQKEILDKIISLLHAEIQNAWQQGYSQFFPLSYRSWLQILQQKTNTVYQNVNQFDSNKKQKIS